MNTLYFPYLIEDLPSEVAVGIAVLSFLIGPVFVYFTKDWWEARKIKRLKKSLLNSYSETERELRILDKMTILPGVRRAVIIQNTNGGGIPKLGSPIYSTIIAPEKWNSNWDKQLINQEFAEIIIKLLENKTLNLNVGELEVDGLLYNAFTNQDIVCSQLRELTIGKESYTFISIDFYLPYDEIELDVREDLRILINRLADLYRNSKSLGTSSSLH